MNAIKWQRITSPAKVMRKFHKLKERIKTLEERVAKLERIINGEVEE